MKKRQTKLMIFFQVDQAVSSIPSSKEPYLHHVAETFLVIRRKDENPVVEMKNYQGLNETDYFSQQLIFNPSMFDDHMPGGYDYIFEGLSYLGKVVPNFCFKELGILAQHWVWS